MVFRRGDVAKFEKTTECYDCPHAGTAENCNLRCCSGPNNKNVTQKRIIFSKIGFSEKIIGPLFDALFQDQGFGRDCTTGALEQKRITIHLKTIEQPIKTLNDWRRIGGERLDCPKNYPSNTPQLNRKNDKNIVGHSKNDRSDPKNNITK